MRPLRLALERLRLRDVLRQPVALEVRAGDAMPAQGELLLLPGDQVVRVERIGLGRWVHVVGLPDSDVETLAGLARWDVRLRNGRGVLRRA